MVDKEEFSKDYLSCWYSNATSLNNKFDEFFEEINASKSQVVFVCETWWTDKSATNVPGYNLYRKDRQFSRGGGVCIYIRDNLNSYPVNEKCLFGTPLHAGIKFFQILNYSHYLNFYKATLLGHTDTADLLIKNIKRNN